MRHHWLALVAVASLGLALACSNPLGKGDGELDPTLVRTVERGELVDEVSESGRITAAFQVDIKSKVSGEVKAVYVVDGQAVRKGDPLYDIIDTDYQRDAELARVGLTQAKLQRDNAEVERQRKERALASRGISEAEYDVAKRQVDLAKVGVDQARIQLDASLDRLAYTKIASPIDGVVIARNIEPGEMVTAGVTATVNGEPALTIAQVERLLLELDLNQVDVAKVSVGQTARILLDAYPGTEVVGTVTQIAAAGHTDTQRGIDVFTVKVELDPSTSTVAIKPGMTAEVRIRTGSWPDVVKLPAESVFEDDGKDVVYAVKSVDGKDAKEKVPVTIGHRSDREVEIVSGLAAGDRFYAQGEVKDLAAKID